MFFYIIMIFCAEKNDFVIRRITSGELQGKVAEGSDIPDDEPTYLSLGNPSSDRDLIFSSGVDDNSRWLITADPKKAHGGFAAIHSSVNERAFLSVDDRSDKGIVGIRMNDPSEENFSKNAVWKVLPFDMNQNIVDTSKANFDPNEIRFHQIRLENTGLCLAGHMRSPHVEECKPSDTDQMFKVSKFNPTNSPAVGSGSSNRSDRGQAGVGPSDGGDDAPLLKPSVQGEDSVPSVGGEIGGRRRLDVASLGQRVRDLKDLVRNRIGDEGPVMKPGVKEEELVPPIADESGGNRRLNISSIGERARNLKSLVRKKFGDEGPLRKRRKSLEGSIAKSLEGSIAKSLAKSIEAPISGMRIEKGDSKEEIQTETESKEISFIKSTLVQTRSGVVHIIHKCTETQTIHITSTDHTTITNTIVMTQTTTVTVTKSVTLSVKPTTQFIPTTYCVESTTKKVVCSSIPVVRDLMKPHESAAAQMHKEQECKLPGPAPKKRKRTKNQFSNAIGGLKDLEFNNLFDEGDSECDGTSGCSDDISEMFNDYKKLRESNDEHMGDDIDLPDFMRRKKGSKKRKHGQKSDNRGQAAKSTTCSTVNNIHSAVPQQPPSQYNYNQPMPQPPVQMQPYQNYPQPQQPQQPSPVQPQQQPPPVQPNFAQDPRVEPSSLSVFSTITCNPIEQC